jgi:hypothetical protein
MTRRAILASALGGSALLVAGCSSASIPVLSNPDPDDEVRGSVLVDELALIAAYDEVITANPSLAGQLRPLRDQHRDHVAAIGDDLDMPTPSSTPSRASVPRSDALRSLRRLESAATRQRIDASVAAAEPELAQLLARIGAAESGHVAYLSGDLA